MLFQLSPTSSLPLREQIVRRLRELILRGDLDEDVQLPSIRRLAKQQRVGIVTVQRAYEDLEREGIIYSRQGKGYFVARIGDESRQDQAARRAAAMLERPLREARQMGLKVHEITSIVRRILGPEEG
jgi:GntR family transcriptional regulator